MQKNIQRKIYEFYKGNEKETNVQYKPYYIYSSEKLSDFIKPNTIQSIITSPPYGTLKNYGIPEQIGFNEIYPTYIQRLNTVWAECFKVLKDNGTFWLNIGSQSINRELKYFGADLSFEIRKIGFSLKGIFYWYKRNYRAGYSKNNILENLEPIYLFAKNKNKIKFYHNREVFDDFNMDFKYNINSWILLRKGGSLKQIKNKRKNNLKQDRNIPHFATFPYELVRRAIILSTDIKDIVLDPFLGSGTTVKCALENGRLGTGFEINPEFEELIKCRIYKNDDFNIISKWAKDFKEKYEKNPSKMNNY